MKSQRTLLFLVAAALATWLPLLGAQGLDRHREENQIVAKVNKAIITRRDVEREILPTLLALEADPIKSKADKSLEGQFHFRAKVNEKISQELTVQLGRQAGIVVPEEFVESRLLERADEVQGLPNLVQVLSQQGLTLDQFRKSIEEDEIVREVLLGSTGLKPSEELEIPPLDTYIGPKEIWEYYQKHQSGFTSEKAAKISMIMISKRKQGEDAAKRANEARQQALSGESFSSISDHYSDYSVTRDAGGRLGKGEWLKPGEVLRDEFEQVVWGLPRGGLSDLVETKTGYFLFRIDDKQEASVASFAEVQNRVRGRLQNQRLQENFRRIQTKLRHAAYVWPESILGDGR